MKKNQGLAPVVIIIAILVLLAVGGAVYYSGTSRQTKEENASDAESKSKGNQDDLVSFSVFPYDTVSGVLSFSGIVKNGYFFEGNIGINILDQNKKLLKAGHGTATTDWMTSGPVTFAGSIDLTGLPTSSGYIQIANDNPSDMREYDKFIYIPIVISSSKNTQAPSETEILASLKTNWQSIQATFKNRPGHPGTTAWSGPYMVQFIGKNNLLVDYEDGYVASINILNYDNGNFKTLETFNNRGLFTLSEWQNLVKKYGDSAYSVSSYSINAIRDNKIVSFPELTKVPENVFVKDFPVVPQSDTYTYKNHGFTIELPKGFVPHEEQSEGGPYIIIELPDKFFLTYVTDYSFYEKYELPNYAYQRDEKIGETIFKFYRIPNDDAGFYLFRRGNVAYQFNLNDIMGYQLKELLKTFRFVGWPQN